MGYTGNMIHFGIYTPQELSEWLPKIQKLSSIAERTFIFASNHWWWQAVRTIRQLRLMLD